MLIKGTAAYHWINVLKQSDTFALECGQYVEICRLSKQKPISTVVIGRMSRKTFNKIRIHLISEDGHCFEIAKCPDCGDLLHVYEVDQKCYCFNAGICFFGLKSTAETLRLIRERGSKRQYSSRNTD